MVNSALWLVRSPVNPRVGSVMRKISNNYLFILFLFDGGNRLPYNIICHYYELFLKEVLITLEPSIPSVKLFNFFFLSTFCTFKCSL